MLPEKVSSLSLELVSMLSISSSGSMFCSSSKLEKSDLNRKDVLRNRKKIYEG